MKTKFYSVCVALIAMSCILFTACSDDDDNSTVTPEKGTFKNATLTLSYEVTQDLLDIANIEITYMDETGKIATEPMSSTKWSKAITSTILPFSAGYKVNITRNSAELSKETYTIGFGNTSTASYLLSNSTDQVDLMKSGISTLSTLSAERIEQYIEAVSEHNNKYAYRIFDDNGTVSCESDTTLSF